MNNLKHATIILDTKYFVKQFLQQTTLMSNLDYDLNELITLILDVVNNKYVSELNVIHFCESYKSLGSLQHAETPDGLILSEALKPLALEIYRQVQATKLFDETGKFPYRFLKLLNDDIALIPLD